MTKKIIITVLALVIAGAIVGGYFFPRALHGFGSSAGATFNSAKFAGIVMNPSTGTATTSSILNTDASDRYVTGAVVSCENLGTSQTAYTGAGLANLLVTIGTSSASAPAAFSPWARVGQLTVATTTASSFQQASSTTQTATSTLPTIWHSGEYMTFSFNATNTAACTTGVNYVGS